MSRKDLREPSSGESGFVMIDALVGLLLCALVLAVVIQSTVGAMKDIKGAAALRLLRAEAALRLAVALKSSFGEGGQGSSADDQRLWRLTVTRDAHSASGPFALCVYRSEMVDKRTQKSVRLETRRVCRLASSNATR
jgi:hypothetical protein